MTTSFDTSFNAPVDEPARRRFEKAWRQGNPEAVEACLPGAESPEYLGTLEELVVIDVEMRWRSRPGADGSPATPGARPPRLDEYLDRFPVLRQPAVLRRLVHGDYRVRHMFGDRPDAQEYLTRFPGAVRSTTEFDTPLPPRTKPDAAPRSIAGYDIRGVLGRGGMAVVYKAWQKRLNRTVALKTMLHGDHATFEDRVRFMNEAELMARLHHLNIIQVFEIDHHEGRSFISMEYVAGGSLADYLKRSPPSNPRTAADFVERVARAVEYAHQQGIVHRDLKPANILLQPPAVRHSSPPGESFDAPTQSQVDLRTATPKVTDFGLAKHMACGVGLTLSGVVIGTPKYMAPEQAAGKSQSVGPATDVHALGAILYELLTGRPPFQASAVLDTLEQVRTQEPGPASGLQPEVPQDLDTICSKCLRKEPDHRYSSAADLADDLARFLQGEPVRARPVGTLERLWRWARRNSVVATLSGTLAAMLLAGAAGASLMALRLDRADRSEYGPRKRAAEQTASERSWRDAARLPDRVPRRTGSRALAMPMGAFFDEGDVRQVAFQPRGTHVLAIDHADNLRVWDMVAEAVLPWDLSTTPVNCATWNADGTQLLVGTASGLDVREFPAGRIMYSVAVAGGVEAMALGPSGQRLALAGRHARLWDLSKKEWTTPELPLPAIAASMYSSPDGCRFVVTCRGGTARLLSAQDEAIRKPLSTAHGSGPRGQSTEAATPIVPGEDTEALPVASRREVGGPHTSTGPPVRERVRLERVRRPAAPIQTGP